MPGISNAVFLSYASEDAEAAERVASALRAAGVEVWFDKSELRGGDAWDRQIRGQIRDCALFVPIISANSQARPEGYFRLEWDLADQRTHLMGRNRAFVIPLCMDATREREADVPDSFLAVQWTRLPAGAQPAAFVERVQGLLSGETSTTRGAAAVPGVASPQDPISASGWPRLALMMGAAVVIAGVVYLAIERPWISRPATLPTAAAAVPAAFAPPPHSIAVLPFVNLSGDKEQEYFSDGLTEELLNSLSQINDLQVAARTSAFSFKGSNTDIGTIAHKLNVAAVLEGSVRRSEHTMRVTAQLINAVTGFHLWSKTYDRDTGDVLKLQTEIATAVAEALKVTLLGDIAQKIELGGTRNPAAFDAYLRASKAFQSRHEEKDIPASIATYTEAIRLDQNFALAFAGRAVALGVYAGNAPTVAAAREGFEKAERDARQAITLAPELAEAHSALAFVFEIGMLDFSRASEEYERALALAPGNAEVLRSSSEFAAYMGHFESAIAAARRAVVLDPLDPRSRSVLGWALYAARRYAESATAYAEAISLNPDYKNDHGNRGRAFYVLGDLESGRASCEVNRDNWWSQWCLAMVYEKLGRRADAEAELWKMKSAFGDAGAVQYATIYAQWGETPKALEWLDTALRLRDPGLEGLKFDPLFDPLRQEPRFQAIKRELKFPD
jgi:TolB-like protein/Flp pilus assembly protein TadD